MADVLFEISLPVVFKKKKTGYVAHCPPLDVHSQGNTLSEAKKNIAEALRLFLTTCYERGTLDAALRELGFRTVDQNPQPPKSKDFVTIPLPLRAGSHHSPECRV